MSGAAARTGKLYGKEYKNIIKAKYRDRYKTTFQIMLIETCE